MTGNVIVEPSVKAARQVPEAEICYVVNYSFMIK